MPERQGLFAAAKDFVQVRRKHSHMQLLHLESDWIPGENSAGPQRGVVQMQCAPHKSGGRR